jgi:hypothetical protein
MLFLRSARTLSFMRRLALIAVGAAVAASFLLPAVAAWLREPAPMPLPDPVDLTRAASASPDKHGVGNRVAAKLRAGARSYDRSLREGRRASARGARPGLTSQALLASTVTSEDDDDQSDQTASSREDDVGGAVSDG